MPRNTINESLASYFPYECLVEEPTITVDETGDQLEEWSPFVTADAAMAPNIGQEEVQSRQEILKYDVQIMLNGSYDVTAYMRVTINNIVYNIIKVDYTEVKSDNLDLPFTLMKCIMVE